MPKPAIRPPAHTCSHFNFDGELDIANRGSVEFIERTSRQAA